MGHLSCKSEEKNHFPSLKLMHIDKTMLDIRVEKVRITWKEYSPGQHLHQAFFLPSLYFWPKVFKSVKKKGILVKIEWVKIILFYSSNMFFHLVSKRKSYTNLRKETTKAEKIRRNIRVLGRAIFCCVIHPPLFSQHHQWLQLPG